MQPHGLFHFTEALSLFTSNQNMQTKLERISKPVLTVRSTAFRRELFGFRLKPGTQTWVLNCPLVTKLEALRNNAKIYCQSVFTMWPKRSHFNSEIAPDTSGPSWFLD